MFNLALGWAFLVSALASPGGRLLALAIDPAVLRTLPAQQQVLANLFANYWLPAFAFYLLLKALRADRFLDPGRGVHILFGVANAVLTLYAALRVFTVTVEGGGATYALAAIGALAVPPCWLALGAGTAWLAIRSVASRGRHARTGVRWISIAGTIVGIVMLSPPLAFFYWVYVSRHDQVIQAGADRQVKGTRFEELCASMRADVHGKAIGVKSVLFTQRSELLYSLLDHVDFTELEETDWNKKAGHPPYLRIVRKEQRKWDSTPISEPESRYQIFHKAVTAPADRALGFYVEETSIRDRRSGELLATFTRLNDLADKRAVRSDDVKSCPRGFERLAYRHDMTLYVLGLMDDARARTFADRIAKIPGARPGVKAE